MVKSRWVLYSPPPRTKLGLQLKYGAISLNNQLKTSQREVVLTTDLQEKPHRHW